MGALANLNRSLWGVAGAAPLLLACGSNGNSGFPDSGVQGPSDDGSGNIQPEDATTSSSDGPVITFEAGAGTSPPATFKCQPGTYKGCFDTKVAGIATWSGALSITLVATDAGTVSKCGGENFDCYTSLTIAPGAQIAGKDDMGGSFALNLSGALDCTPDSGPPTLSGTLNGGYCFFRRHLRPGQWPQRRRGPQRDLHEHAADARRP
ncbi:MAG: hypothetical protein ACLP1X_13875 [Polyangiaceae bacterium]|jgi:hypothetical protein